MNCYYLKKRLPVLLLVSIFLIGSFVMYYLSEQSKLVSLQSLLKEMIDRDRICEFPQVKYQTKQASSYNRTSISPDLPGWFEDSDGLYCMGAEENMAFSSMNEWILMEDKGPGAIVKMWAVCFYYGLKDTKGANIKIYLDGAKQPIIETNFFALLQGRDFVGAPFADQSVRAGNLYLPIPYAKSCKITVDRKPFYYIINYRKYPKGTSVKTFTMEDYANSKNLIKTVGKTLLAKAKEPESAKTNGTIINRNRTLKKDQELLFDLPPGNNTLSYLELKLQNLKDTVQTLRSFVMEGIFDDKLTVWAPVGDFFNNVGKIRPYEMWERTVKPDGTMICRWRMPYQKTGRIRFKNLGDHPVSIKAKIITEVRKWSKRSMHFYATWNISNPTTTFPIYDYNFLEATGKGVLVGDALTVLNPIEGWWGEGDEKIYVDEDFDKKFPSHFGTGTEDYYGFAGGLVPKPEEEFSKPFLGSILVGNPNAKGYNVCTRTRSLDAIPFSKKIKFDIESSCGKRSNSHYLQYSEIVFWYARPNIQYNRKLSQQFVREAKAKKKVPQISDLETLIKAAKKKVFIVKGCIEAESLEVASKSKGVKIKNITNKKWRKTNYIDGLSGEISNGALKTIYFEKKSDYVTFKISKRFQKEKANAYLAASINQNSSVFDIFVNDKKLVRQNFRSDRNRIASLLKLGSFGLKDKTLTVRIEYVGDEKKGAKLDLDYFIVK